MDDLSENPAPQSPSLLPSGIRRVLVEKLPAHRAAADELLRDLREQLDIPRLTGLRVFQRYDVEGLEPGFWEAACATVFSDPPVDAVFQEGAPLPWADSATVFAVEYLPGQFDQRADSATQCIQILSGHRPTIAAAHVYALEGSLSASDLARIKSYLINPVDSREASLAKPASLTRAAPNPPAVPRLQGFTAFDEAALAALHRDLGLAMSAADLAFCQTYFRDTAGRDPTLTEIKVLDTYWSDHCRHTTFLTELAEVKIDDSPAAAPLRAAWAAYLAARERVFGDKTAERPPCLMDLALLAMREMKKSGQIPDLDDSEEVNAASIRLTAEIDGQPEEWLVMFKNETHNHPTEIEPFGGAATCLGGAIRDPLSGRSYVYQAMRVTGAADPRVPLSETLPGKLPQRVITREAARGYSSYGNQIGVATGIVAEVYHPRFVAKRMEIGAVIAAAPAAQVLRERPAPGDRVVLVGGFTGRDGVGGATGSSKEHTETALENSAEVQKGNPPTERHLQRLFRRPEVARRIKRCNDFGAGGVAVAIGELAPSLRVDLDKVPLKYDGLDGTEIAISESQERMAVVLDPADVEPFIAAAAEENLTAVVVAEITDSGALEMDWRGDRIVDLRRDFIDTNGVRQQARAHLTAPEGAFPALINSPPDSTEADTDLLTQWTAVLGDLNVCDQRGLVERFDSSIGAGTVLSPFGGRYQRTPAEAMAATLPVLEGETPTATLMAHGYHPAIGVWSPYHGAVYAVLEAVARIVASGGRLDRIRLTLQEYFEKLRDDPVRWGKPLAALLGAYHAQTTLGIPAIGGKDSMSGSFQDIDVPPTLVAFAVAPVDARTVISPEFKAPGNRLWHLPAPIGSDALPDLATIRTLYTRLADAVAAGRILSAQSLRAGGFPEGLTKMAVGNRLGARLQADALSLPPTAIHYGSFVLETPPGDDLADLGARPLGEVIEAPQFEIGETTLLLADLQAAWETPLESVFPTRAPEPTGTPPSRRFAPARPAKARARVAKPRVFIPVFPGTNTEYDTARAFARAGAEPVVRVFRNFSDAAVESSLAGFAEALRHVQILMLPGGFSAGDEPDGSGKFIAAVLRSPRVRDAVHGLIHERDGLILGICNGFQALVKTGLLPFGEIRPGRPGDPTLAHNTIGRHVSTYVRTRVVSLRSPWLSLCRLGEEHWIPVSHGEGRFCGDPTHLRALVENDQIATQYTGHDGHPSYRIDDNPNGSLYAIEGITSECGRIFGKMGHTERFGPHVVKNIPGNKDQPLFKGGVAYYS